MQILAKIVKDTLELIFNEELDMFSKSSIFILLLESDRTGMMSLDEFYNMVIETEHIKTIELDLNNVDYMDSSGLAFIFNIIKKLRILNKIAHITKIQPRVLQSFKLLNLDTYVSKLDV